ncbi:hypothetical protein QOT17_006040 [Balamuthia mandrillaris]
MSDKKAFFEEQIKAQQPKPVKKTWKTTGNSGGGVSGYEGKYKAKPDLGYVFTFFSLSLSLSLVKKQPSLLPSTLSFQRLLIFFAGSLVTDLLLPRRVWPIFPKRTPTHQCLSQYLSFFCYLYSLSKT